MFMRPLLRQPFICQYCLRLQVRRHASSSPRNPLPPPPSGAAKLTNRRLISLHGQDAPKFLQGIITNNVRPDSQIGFFAAFLTAQGKVLHDVFVYPTLGSKFHEESLAQSGNAQQPGFLVEVDGEQAGDLLKHITRHKLRSKFGVRLIDEGELDVWSAWRVGEKWTPHTQSNTPEDGLIGLVDSRAPGLGQRVLLPGATPLDQQRTLAGLEVAPLIAYTIRRYLRGVPEGQHEMPRDSGFPMNMGIDVMGGIDFRKGCYLGQELTIRTHHTGVVRRRVLPVILYNSAEAPPEKCIYDQSVDVSKPEENSDIKKVGGKRQTGKFIAGIGNVGLATCRLENMTDLVVTGEGNTYTAADRFVAKDATGSEVGIQPFAPDWLRGKIRMPKVQ